MNRVIYPNRAFIWIIVAIMVSDFLLWASIERFTLEQETLNQSLILSLQKGKKTSWKVFVDAENGYRLGYPAHYALTRDVDTGKTCFRISSGSNLGFCARAYKNTDKLDAQGWWDKNRDAKQYALSEGISISGSKSSLMLSPVEESYGSSVLIAATAARVYVLEGNIPSGTIQSLMLGK